MTIRSILPGAAALGAIALSSPVTAQDAPDADDANGTERLRAIGMIVVTGRGLDDTPGAAGYSTVEIDPERLLSTPSGRIEDALGSIAGFQQFRRSDSRSANPSAQGATLRALGGNATSRALVLLDGVPMADPFFGSLAFSAIAPERLSGVKVTRGGGSGPFGAGALAGTIALTSAGAAEISPVSASLLGNDRGETEASASLSHQWNDGFARLSGRWDRGEGFYTTPSDRRVPASAKSAFDAKSLQLRAVSQVSSDIELQARALAFEDERTLRFKGADNAIRGHDASLRLVGRGAWQFDVLAYAQNRNFNNIVISSTRFVPVLDQRNTPSTGLGGKIELRPPVGDDHILRLGLDFRQSEGELYETAYSAFSGAVTANRNAGGTNTDLGLFAETDWTMGRLTLSGGARLDRYAITGGFFTERDGSGALVIDETYADRSGWQGSFRGSARLRVSGAVALRAAAYTGLRLPTLNELYRPFVVFPVVTQANASLGNERLVGFEAGLDYAPSPGLSLSLTAFDNRVNDAIANVTIADNLRQRRNVDALRSRGVEADAHAERGAFRFDASLAWTYARVEGSGVAVALDGLRPAQTPEWSASATLGYRPRENWLMSITLRHVGAQFESDLETNLLPAATTFDAFASIPLSGKFALVLRAENLTDEQVITRDQSGSIDLGAPRTIWAGLRFGF